MYYLVWHNVISCVPYLRQLVRYIYTYVRTYVLLYIYNTVVRIYCSTYILYVQRSQS